MVAVITLVYEDETKNRKLDVPVHRNLKGQKLIDAIDKRVTALAKDDSWDRWELVSVKE